ncbi:MAG: gliding motility lipoprotein GldH [Bacteroides sp.]|jgi:gliding motility-associated lipoprotein GldH|nr:gliding motility lipoprotein GldH [Bacteroides sp.]
MPRTDKYLIFLLLAIAGLLTSCDRSVVFEGHKALPASGWPYTEKVHFEALIEDTTSLHNMYVDVRNTTDYGYSNLYLFLDIEFPDGTLLRDTLECTLAEKSGEWTGKGFGKIRSNRFLFRTDVWFPGAGKYFFGVEQAMRTDKLEGIADIGLRIERK